MIEIHETLTGHSRIDFDKKKIRKAMRRMGSAVRKDARRLVARRAISSPGEYPGKLSGTLMRSIQSKVSRSGFMVRISPFKTEGMKDFYPAFLSYGTSRGVAPRKNYMTDALDKNRSFVRSTLKGTLLDSLKPR